MRFIKFDEITLQRIATASQNTFGIEKMLKIDGATSVLMRGHG